MSMDQKIILFAREYASERSNTLSAYSAFFRMEQLIEDARVLIANNKQVAEHADEERHIWSYYIVGFVTCLEWHARARIQDLFTHKPEAIQPDDFRAVMSAKFFSQLVRERIQVPALIAASLSVGSAEAYLKVFSRVFAALGDGESVWDVARDKVVVNGENALESMFEYRHRLVHEIGYSVIGRPWQLDLKSPSDILSSGERVLGIMKTIEAHLYAIAPSDFPNLINEDHSPRSEIDRLDGQIEAAEERLSRLIIGFDDTSADWRRAVHVARHALNLSDSAIENSTTLCGTMFLRLRQSMHLANRRSRLAFLQFVLTEFDALGLYEAD